jgi:serine/threonine protein kinase
MEVYCTNSLTQGEPHLAQWPNPPQDSAAREQWQKQMQSCHCSECGMPLLLGNGRYLPFKDLGRGGFGCVFLAYDLKFPDRSSYERRAIKQFRYDQSALPGRTHDALKAFEAEVSILDKLKHPQIPRVYEPFNVKFEGHSYAYFVQEYVVGKSLQQMLDANNNELWSETTVQDMLRQLLEILKYLHSRPSAVIHSDIKPSNIIKAADGKYHLIDFGAFQQAIAKTTLSGRISPVPIALGYSPPEQQFHGQVWPVSDLYALAKTCICLLTGSPGGSLQDSLSGFRRRTVSPQFKQLLLRMSHSERAMRPNSASEVLQELDNFYAEPVVEPVVGPTQSPGRRYRSLRYALIAVCVVAILLIAHFISAWLNHPQIPVRDWQVQEEYISSVTSAPPLNTYFYGGSRTAEPLATEIDGRIAQVVPELIVERKPPTQIYEHSEEGIDRLREGKLDFALSSKVIPTQAENADRRRVKLEKISVARTTVTAVVHPQLPIEGITREQLKKIYVNEFKNWRDLGGPDLPITIYATDAKYVKFSDSFEPKDGIHFTPKDGIHFTQVNVHEEAFQKIQENPGGLMLAPTPVALNSPTGCTLKALKFGMSVDTLVHPYQEAKVYSSEDCQNGKRNKANLEAIQPTSTQFNKNDISVIVVRDGGIKQWVGEYYAYVLTTEEARNIMQELGYVPILEVEPQMEYDSRLCSILRPVCSYFRGGATSRIACSSNSKFCPA